MAEELALSVKNLKTFFYTNKRCNKAVNGLKALQQQQWIAYARPWAS